jgi:nicotinamide-nucleotide amidase
MQAAILAVGSELLGAERLDTNSLRLTESLLRHGVELRRKSVIGDVEEEIAAELRDVLPRLDLVLISGGLGPTADDVTREAVAAALGRGLRLDPGALAALETRFQKLGWKMPAVNRKQAEVIDGAELLANPRGSAPGMRLSAGAATLFLFPGVPSELAGMAAEHLEPWLAARSGGAGTETAVLKIAGLPESLVEERIAPAYDEFGRRSITILARPGEVRLLASATGPAAEREARLRRMTARLADLVGDAVFAWREEDTLESVVGSLLRGAGATLAVAESCTGGLLGERLTRVAGSSDYFLGGAITYSNRLKSEMVGVPPALIAAHGAVSEEVARAMAAGVRAALHSQYGAAITGVAGPDGGSDEKPVGTVHLALAGPDTRQPAPGHPAIEHRRLRLPGDRERVRWQATQLALDMLRRRLLADSRAGAAAGEVTAAPGTANAANAADGAAAADASDASDASDIAGVRAAAASNPTAP